MSGRDIRVSPEWVCHSWYACCLLCACVLLALLFAFLLALDSCGIWSGLLGGTGMDSGLDWRAGSGYVGVGPWDGQPGAVNGNGNCLCLFV